MALSFIRCPSCGIQLAQRSGIRDSFYEIGPPLTVCPHCQETIKTGGTEWADMTMAQKLGRWGEAYAYHILLLGPLSAFAVGMGLRSAGLPLWAYVLAAAIVYAFLVWAGASTHRQQVTASLRRKPARDVCAPLRAPHDNAGAEPIAAAQVMRAAPTGTEEVRLQAGHEYLDESDPHPRPEGSRDEITDKFLSRPAPVPARPPRSLLWLALVAIFVVEFFVVARPLADTFASSITLAGALGAAIAPLAMVCILGLAPLALWSRYRRRPFASLDRTATTLVLTLYGMSLGGRALDPVRTPFASRTRQVSAATTGLETHARHHDLPGCDFSITFFAPTIERTVEAGGLKIATLQTADGHSPFCRAECIPARIESQEHLGDLLRRQAHQAGLINPEIATARSALGLFGTYQSVVTRNGFEIRLYGKIIAGPNSSLHLLVSEPLTGSLSAPALAFMGSPTLRR